jgi:hypothetical protein
MLNEFSLGPLRVKTECCGRNMTDLFTTVACELAREGGLPTALAVMIC